MRIALLADIHANLEALEACLAHARPKGAERFAFLGDLVGYGADPTAVLEIVAPRAAQGEIVVKGNHDEAIASQRFYSNDSVAAVIEWTRERLSAPHREFLEALPLLVRDGGACYVHASAAAPQRWEYIDSPREAARSMGAAGEAYTFSGHVHEQVLFSVGPGDKPLRFRPEPGVAIPVGAHRRWLVLPGSVGQPRDGNPASGYALVDFERGGTVTFHRVPYDHYRAAAKVRAAGLPELLAYRLERGV